MAKKKAGTQQTTFEGDGFPKNPPKAVRDARDEYLSAMRHAAEASKNKGDREQRLIELMKKHDVDRIRLDGENKFIEIGRAEKAKVKTIPKEQRDARQGRED